MKKYITFQMAHRNLQARCKNPMIRILSEFHDEESVLQYGQKVSKKTGVDVFVTQPRHLHIIMSSYDATKEYIEKKTQELVQNYKKGMQESNECFREKVDARVNDDKKEKLKGNIKCSVTHKMLPYIDMQREMESGSTKIGTNDWNIKDNETTISDTVKILPYKYKSPKMFAICSFVEDKSDKQEHAFTVFETFVDYKNALQYLQEKLSKKEKLLNMMIVQTNKWLNINHAFDQEVVNKIPSNNAI